MQIQHRNQPKTHKASCIAGDSKMNYIIKVGSLKLKGNRMRSQKNIKGERNKNLQLLRRGNTPSYPGRLSPHETRLCHLVTYMIYKNNVTGIHNNNIHLSVLPLCENNRCFDDRIKLWLGWSASGKCGPVGLEIT